MICLLLSLYIGGDVYDVASACPDAAMGRAAVQECIQLDDPETCEVIESPNGDLTVEYKFTYPMTEMSLWKGR